MLDSAHVVSLLMEVGKAKPHLAVGVAVGLDEERVLLEEARDIAAPQEAELAVELAGVVEAEDELGLACFDRTTNWCSMSCARTGLRAAMRFGDFGDEEGDGGMGG